MGSLVLMRFLSRLSWRARALAAVLWVTLVATGFGIAAHHEATPGSPPAAPPTWPAELPVRLDPARLTLLLFAHPRCPCTAATLSELARLVADCGSQPCCYIFFYSDPAVPGFEATELWDQAGRIPGVLVASPGSGHGAEPTVPAHDAAGLMPSPNGSSEHPSGTIHFELER